MWPYLPDLLHKPVPRYTSYPTAAEFHANVGSKAHVAHLQALPKNTPVSLYVHIPFCREICWYCGCNTNRANKSSRLTSYLNALEQEVDWLASQVAGQVQLDRISFGGGSPNAIEPLQFIRLFTHIITLFGSQKPDISIELDPRTLTPAWTVMVGKIGATRASLGVQTLEPHIMEAIGRVQPLGQIAQATQWLRDAGIQSLNFDLMYGLPGQSLQDLQKTLDSALELRPDRIALFGYAHVPQVIPRQRQIDAGHLPDMASRFQQSLHGYQTLVKAGYVPIGFDHFALPHDSLAKAHEAGMVRRNFQGFTDDQADVLLGVGATSITSMPDLIVQNEKNLGRYNMRVMAGTSAAELGVVRTTEDRARGLVIEELLCGRTADIPDMDRQLALQLRPYIEAGLCTLQEDQLSITPHGLPYSRLIAAVFDGYRNHSQGRFSAPV